LNNVISQYGFDLAAVVPIDFLLTPPTLGSPNRQQTFDEKIVSANSGRTPEDSIDQLAQSVDERGLQDGEARVRVTGAGGPGDATMHDITPVHAEHVGADEVRRDTVVGAVIVGSSAGSVRGGFMAQSKWLIGIAVLTLALGMASSWVTSRGLRRVTGDYGADELSSMLDFYSSVLKAVSEGLLLVDRSRGIVLINSEARE